MLALVYFTRTQFPKAGELAPSRPMSADLITISFESSRLDNEYPALDLKPFAQKKLEPNTV